MLGTAICYPQILVPLELYISNAFPLLSFNDPLTCTLYKLAVEVLVIVIFASVFTACLIVSKYTLAALISFISELEFATNA